VLNIYRKYYGLKMTAFLLVTMYCAMALSAFVVEGIFGAAGMIPHEHNAKIVETAVQWDYTTVLNIIFAALSALMLIRFFKTGGVKMLRMMQKPGKPGHHRASEAT
jgi:uncharacterized protein